MYLNGNIDIDFNLVFPYIEPTQFLSCWYHKLGYVKLDVVQVFLLIDHSVSSARIVLEKNKFSKKLTSNRD